MFSNEEIAEVMVEEIGETCTGQNRSMVTVFDERDDVKVSRTLYRRRTSTAGKTTYRDINVFEPCASPRGQIGSRPIHAGPPAMFRMVMESKGNLVFSDPEASRSYDMDGSIRPSLDTGYRHVQL